MTIDEVDILCYGGGVLSQLVAPYVFWADFIPSFFLWLSGKKEDFMKNLRAISRQQFIQLAQTAGSEIERATTLQGYLECSIFQGGTLLAKSIRRVLENSQIDTEYFISS